jgi:hypothetical protein
MLTDKQKAAAQRSRTETMTIAEERSLWEGVVSRRAWHHDTEFVAFLKLPSDDLWWLEQVGPKYDDYRLEDLRQRYRSQFVGGGCSVPTVLPDLAGSPAQVEWATDIRARVLAKAVYGRADFMGWLAAHAEASWWIDYRDFQVFYSPFGFTLWALFTRENHLQ